MRRIVIAWAAFCLVAGTAARAVEPPDSRASAAESQAAAGAPPAGVLLPATDNQAAPGLLPADLPLPATDNQAAAETPPAPAAPPADNQAAPGAPPAGLPLPATDNQAAAGTARPPSADNVAPARPPVYISMDFTDVELPVLIKFMSEQTKRNFIFDERVAGKITIISPRRITLPEAYDVFLAVLQVKGFTTVEQGNAIKIVPLRDAKQEGLPTGKGALDRSVSEFITRLIPLQYVDAADVVTLLAPMISKDGLLTSFPASNMIILIDSQANIERILRIVAEIDQAGVTGTLRLFTLKYAAVADVVRVFDTLYQEAPAAPPGARGRPGRPGKARGVAPRFIPDARTNSLIVLAPADLLEDVEDLLRKLDVPSPEITGKINVYYLENANAEEMSKVLSQLAEKRPGGPAAPAQPPGAPKGIITAELEGGVRITADAATNSLIIIASLNDYQVLVEVIRKLDIRRRQVYLEGLVMEIDLDKALDVGVEFRGATQAGSDDEGAILGGTNFNFQGNVNDLFSILGLGGSPLIFPGTGLIAGGIAGNVVLPDGTEIPAITAILRAAQRRDNINVLSSPHLLTLDNKEAEIIVAENVPFITGTSQQTTAAGAPVISTIERKDVGIILRVTPHIHESEYVNLEIYQESSAVQQASLLSQTDVGLATTTKRSAKTSVLVKDGQTVVLGGMMQERFITSEQKVPLLGDIPLLGWLFKFKSTTRRKTNLLIFLTPHVIKSPEDMARVTNDHRKKMDTFIEQHKGEIESSFPGPKAEESGP